MIMFLGYAYNSGTFDSDSGGKINWSNFLIRGVSNEGLQFGEVAKELKMSKSTIASYETGRTQPDIEMLGILADFYNVSVDWLLGTKGNNIRDTE